MPTTFETPDNATLSLVANILHTHHQPLHEAGVRIGVIMASSSSEEGHPLTANGWPVMAKTRIVSLKDRLIKEYDAEMLLDLKAWDGLPVRRQAALIDHELCRLELKKFGYTQRHDEGGEPLGDPELWCELDDLGRPKLKTRLGDWCVGEGFNLVVERHGLEALEYRALVAAQSTAEQHAERERTI